MTGTGRPGFVDLGIGQPADAMLPRETLRRAAAAGLAAAAGNEALQYGPEEGAESLRGELARFLSRHYGHPVGPGELLVTSGASHGLDLILGHYTAPGDTVLVEAPSYFFGLDILRARGLALVPVPVDAHGLDPDALHEQLRRHRPRLLYTIPVFHNPTGVTLPPQRRRRLVELAHSYDCLVVADEVYQLVADGDRVPAPMRSHDGDRVLSLGSFSKILAPGVRLGWVECSPARVATLRRDAVLRSGGGVSPVTGLVVETAIREGMQDDYLLEARAIYDRRRRHMVDLLREHLAAEVSVTYPDGGYYVWLELPRHVDAGALLPAAREAGVGFRAGTLFSVDGSFRNCLRLCFTYYDEDGLTAGVERLAGVLSRQLVRGR